MYIYTMHFANVSRGLMGDRTFRSTACNHGSSNDLSGCSVRCYTSTIHYAAPPRLHKHGAVALHCALCARMVCFAFLVEHLYRNVHRGDAFGA